VLNEKKIAFLGAGSMGQALIKGLLEANLVKKEQLLASARSQKTLSSLEEELGISTFLDNREMVKEADIIVLAVKPQMMGEILAEVKDVLQPSQLVISIAAGLSIAYLEENLIPELPVVRVMPNTPCLVREGACGVALGTWAGPLEEEVVVHLLSAVGKVVVVPEKLINAVTGLSGSGPAYIYLVIEALADGGVREGLTRSQALTLAAQTVLGAAKMVLETGEHPGVLKDQVTSPAGTTIEAIYGLERDGIRGAFMNAVTASSKKAEQLGK